MNITTAFPGLNNFSVLGNIDINAMGMDMIADDEMYVSSTVTASYQIPSNFGFSFLVCILLRF
jgi:hypothetical protein